MGCWFSVNQQMLATKSGQALIAVAPRGRVLTETDAPFFEVSGSPLRAGEVLGADEIIAREWRVELDDALDQIFSNALEVLA